MFKKLAIAAACSVALYGLAKVIQRHILLVPDGPIPDAAAPENGQPTGDSANPITTETTVDEEASVQVSDAGGKATAVHVAVPAAEAS